MDPKGLGKIGSIDGITLDKLKQMVEMIGDTKRIVILFTPFLSGHVYYGPFVDKMLACSEHEEGFIVPETCRAELEEYKDAYQEWDPKQKFSNEWRFNWK